MTYLQKTTSAAPLAVLRITLGLMLFASLIRFWAKGWIFDLYIQPKLFFPFYGFEFIKPLGTLTYVLFAFCALSSLAVAFGYRYRLAALSLFASFTYIELMDKSTYLNHYYFISLLCLLLVFLPAHVYFSVDAYRNKNLQADSVPVWCVDAIKLLVFILYFYSGLAKVNSDWLVEALPLRIWLPARNDIPVIGSLLNKSWTPYVFSWFGCAYDLTIVFFLIYRKTRIAAYTTVIIFHAMTALLFPIGMFPYIMILTTMFFLSPESHKKTLLALGKWLKLSSGFLHRSNTYTFSNAASKVLIPGFGIFFVVQLLLPFRYFLYPGELFWTEEGYRFSWRVMLMEKAGYTQFLVKGTNGETETVNNQDFLTVLQEKMMSTQPDMILQYSHMLRDKYAKKGFQSPKVYVDAYVGLNGRLSRQFIDPSVNLAEEDESFSHKSWIIPLNDEIKGF